MDSISLNTCTDKQLYPLTHTSPFQQVCTAVVTFTMHRTPVTLLGIHGEYVGLEPARATPHTLPRDNLTQLTGHARPASWLPAVFLIPATQHANWLACISLTSTVLLNLTSDLLCRVWVTVSA